MKVTHSADDPSVKIEVRNIAPGTAVVNGVGNLCIVCRRGDLEGTGKVQMVNLENGGTYSVQGSCKYEVVQAEVTWSRT